MNVVKFGLYTEDNKKGVIDYKTKKIILHSSYDVDYIDDEKIYLMNGSELFIKDVLKKVNFIVQKQRYIIVENSVSKKLGIYDKKFDVLRVACVCDKIRYSDDNNMFYMVKNGQKRGISYNQLSKLKYESKGEGAMLVNNLSMYYSFPFEIDLKTGKKRELKK